MSSALSALAVREPQAIYAPASEADLAAVWAGQLFARRSLRTEDGAPLRVIYCGLPGAGPGPDFREAVIAGPGGPRHGDVELHVRESDFRRHGHGADPAYANVVLHVVFTAEGARFTPLPGGGHAPVLVLPPPSSGKKAWDPRRAWAEPCATAVARLGPDACAATLDRLGEMRFRQKTHAMRKRLEAVGEADTVLWATLLEGLGYGGPRETFRELAERLPWPQLRAQILAVPLNSRIEAAHTSLSSTTSQIPSRKVLCTPGNGVEARSRGAAALAARFAVNGPLGALLPLVDLPPASASRALIAALSVPRLIGRGRAIELVQNAVLPLAAALAASPAAEEQAEAAYAALPSPARYGAVRHLHRALPELLLTARRGQGMLYLLRGYCTQGGCGKCPLS